MEKSKVDATAFEFDKNDGLEGFEQMGMDTKSVPFLNIVQDLSPQRKKERAEYIEGIDVGMFFNSLTRAIIEKPFRCIVLGFEHMYIEWKPNRGGFVERHTVENAKRLAVDPTKFGKWHRKGTGDGKDPETMNILQETYTYALIIEGHEAEGVIVMSLKSGAMKAAKNWNRLMTTHILADGSKAKPYYLIWSMDTEYVPAKPGKSDYYVPKPTFDSVINDQVMYLTVKQERQTLPEKTIDYAQIEAPDASIETEDF